MYFLFCFAFLNPFGCYSEASPVEPGNTSLPSIAANLCEHRIRPWVCGTAVKGNFMYLHEREKKANSYWKTCCDEVHPVTNTHINFLFLKMESIQGNSGIGAQKKIKQALLFFFFFCKNIRFRKQASKRQGNVQPGNCTGNHWQQVMTGQGQ